MFFFLKRRRNEVRPRRTTLKSGTALAVPAVPGMPPLILTDSNINSETMVW